MIHPLVNTLSNLKDNELEEKILDLSKKYWQSRNPDVQYQIRILLNQFNEELSARRNKTIQQQYENRNQELDKLIKVN